MYLQSSNFDILVGVHIVNTNLFPSFINIAFDVFLTKYKNTCFIAKDPKTLDILFVSIPYFFWDNYIFKALYKKSILQIIKIFIVSTQKLTGKPLSMSNISFIVANILQHLLAISFFLCIYKAAYPILIFLFQQQNFNALLMNFSLPSTYKQPNFSSDKVSV